MKTAQKAPPPERIDLLVPVVTSSDQLESIIALGVKRSEEP